MRIQVTSGSGVGVTKLAAFDKALFDAGIANYNLIKLSSVIPANSKIINKKITNYNNNEYGYKLYIVLAECTVIDSGEEAVAGIGWVKHSPGKESGLFVEFAGRSETEVREKITKTLESMTSYRPEEVGEIDMKIEKIRCKGRPVCAIVAAVYKSEGWV